MPVDSSLPDQPDTSGPLLFRWMKQGREIIPGLIIATVIAVAARYVSEHQAGR